MHNFRLSILIRSYKYKTNSTSQIRRSKGKTNFQSFKPKSNIANQQSIHTFEMQERARTSRDTPYPAKCLFQKEQFIHRKKIIRVTAHSWCSHSRPWALPGIGQFASYFIFDINFRFRWSFLRIALPHLVSVLSEKPKPSE
jgi:hypothetical protein